MWFLVTTRSELYSTNCLTQLFSGTNYLCKIAGSRRDIRGYILFLGNVEKTMAAPVTAVILVMI